VLIRAPDIIGTPRKVSGGDSAWALVLWILLKNAAEAALEASRYRTVRAEVSLELVYDEPDSPGARAKTLLRISNPVHTIESARLDEINDVVSGRKSQLPPSDNKHDSMGLGLATVAGILQKMRDLRILDAKPRFSCVDSRVVFECEIQSR
jgi:hypothetical protein